MKGHFRPSKSNLIKLSESFPPLPPPGFDPKKGCFQGQGKHCKPIAEKVISLYDKMGIQIASMRLLALPPPPLPYPWVSQWMGAIILAGGLLMSLLAGNYIRQSFVEPLIRLSLVVHKVQGGNLSSRIETQNIHQSDVRQTLEKVNNMLESLLEKEQLRNSFISNLTHDFRTLLIAENRSLELLVKEFRQLGLIEPEKLAIGILKNNEHLLTMVNQLLETYQTEAGMFQLELNVASLPALVSECFEQLAPLAKERHITLLQKLPQDFPLIEVDAYYLKRVFINLIGNALDNIPKGSQIEVFGNRVGDAIEIHVRDNGLGIPSEDQKRLFDRYYAGTGDTRKLGSGLGLYICKLLITAHRGSISVESEAGYYTDFIVKLPLSGHEELL